MLEDPYTRTMFHEENIFSGDAAIVFVSFDDKAVVVGAGYNGEDRTILTPDTAEAFANSILEHVEYVRERNKPKLPVTPGSVVRYDFDGFPFTAVRLSTVVDDDVWVDSEDDRLSDVDLHKLPWTLIYDAGADNA